MLVLDPDLDLSHVGQWLSDDEQRDAFEVVGEHAECPRARPAVFALEQRRVDMYGPTVEILNHWIEAPARRLLRPIR